MTSVTERTIFEQFEFLERATGQAVRRWQPGDRLVFIGCGTSYFLAMALASAANVRGIPSVAAPGHEWLRRPEAYLADPGSAHVVAISRSGESTEIVDAARATRAAGIGLTAITCAPQSSLVKLGTDVVVGRTHPDEGVVMTASASVMLSLGLQLVGAAVTADTVAEARSLLLALDGSGFRFLPEKTHFVFLGGGGLFGIAAEGALKLQEMSCTATQFYHPLEYRHGPVSVADEGTLVVLLYNPGTQADEERLAGELSGRGAFVVGIGGSGDLELAVDAPAEVRPLVCLPALQILGERFAGVRNLDTDAPRNLTKVVRIA